MSIKVKRPFRYLRWFTQIAGFFASGFFLLIFIEEGIPALIDKNINSKLLPFLPFLLTAIIGYLIALFKEIIGGILQIASGISMSAYLFAIGGLKNLDLALVFGLPYLFCGLFSLLYGWKCRSTRENKDKS